MCFWSFTQPIYVYILLSNLKERNKRKHISIYYKLHGYKDAFPVKTENCNVPKEIEIANRAFSDREIDYQFLLFSANIVSYNSMDENGPKRNGRKQKRVVASLLK